MQSRRIPYGSSRVLFALLSWRDTGLLVVGIDPRDWPVITLKYFWTVLCLELVHFFEQLVFSCDTVVLQSIHSDGVHLGIYVKSSCDWFGLNWVGFCLYVDLGVWQGADVVGKLVYHGPLDSPGLPGVSARDPVNDNGEKQWEVQATLSGSGDDIKSREKELS